MDEILAKITPTTVGTWTLVVMGLGMWWRGLPALIDAIANRQSKIEERMQGLLDRSTERFAREIEAADERHESCMEGQRKLIKRLEEVEAAREEDRKLINEQTRTIEALNHKITQMQVSAIRVDGQAPSPMIEAAIRSLDEIAKAAS